MSAATEIAGVGPLLRASIHHNVRSFAPWIAIPLLLSVSSVIIYALLFPDLAEREAFAATVGSNPALGLIFGPAFDLTTTDGFNAWRSLALGGFAVALGAVFIVTAASRGQEDSGQAELLASGVLGRQSRLVTAVAMGILMSIVAGVLTGVITALCGGSWGASMILGIGFTAMGAIFAGVAAVTSQIGADARTASSIAVAVLGILFVLRGFCYSIEAPSWTVWINPLGWVTETRPASGDHWLPLIYPVILTLVLVAVAFALQTSRDFGQGLIAARPGPARGTIGSPLGLAIRLNRPPALSWAIAFIALGVVFGYFAGSVKDMFASNPALADIFAAGATSPDELTSAFVVTILGLAGIIASICGVQTMNRMRTEELDDRTEPVLATAVSRIQYLRSNALVALAVPALCILIAGAVMGIFVSFHDLGLTYGDVILQALATIPAAWTVVALAVAVIGARPAVRIASWAGVLLSFVLTLLGPSFKLPDWALGFSPFWHVPDVAVSSSSNLGLIWISLFTVGFLAIGTVGFRRRDTP